MKVLGSIATALSLLLLLSGSGCAVTSNNASAPETMMETVWNTEPRQTMLSGQPMDLRLYFSRQHQDLLVVYKEYPPDNYPMRMRAYWLYESEDRLGRDGHVAFVKTNSAPDLVSLPIFSTTAALATNSPETLCVVATNDYNFTVYSGQREVSSHGLPLHFVKSGTSTAEKIAISPLAICVDGLISKLEHLGEPSFPP